MSFKLPFRRIKIENEVIFCILIIVVANFGYQYKNIQKNKENLL